MTAADNDTAMTDNQANDGNSFDNTQKSIMTNNEVKHVSDSNSFSNLNDKIKESDGEINITCDYTFKEDYDKNLSDGINLINRTLVINGNNHKIDALNQSRIFNILFSNITIKNLTVLNANNSAIVVTTPH